MMDYDEYLERFFAFFTCDWQSVQERLVDNTKINNYTIDTCFCNDTNKYETAIKKFDNAWVIVEEYDTKEQSQEGHKKWVEFAKTEPTKAYSIQFREDVEF